MNMNQQRPHLKRGQYDMLCTRAEVRYRYHKALAYLEWQYDGATFEQWTALDGRQAPEMIAIANDGEELDGRITSDLVHRLFVGKRFRVFVSATQFDCRGNQLAPGEGRSVVRAVIGKLPALLPTSLDKVPAVNSWMN